MDGFTRSVLEATAHTGLQALIELLGEDSRAAHLAGTPRAVLEGLQRIAVRPSLDEAAMLRPVALTRPDVPRRPLAYPDPHDGATMVPVPGVDHAARVMAGPVPWRAVCAAHLAPYAGVSWVCHDPGPDGYPPHPAPDQPEFAFGWRPRARHFWFVAAQRAGGLSTPDYVAVATAEALRLHLGGAGGVCKVRLTAPCPYPHPGTFADDGTVTHGWGVYADPEYTPDGEVTTDEKRRAEFHRFTCSGEVVGRVDLGDVFAPAGRAG